ncbi:MAG TPA: AEC family transporter [Geomonas sp.]|nr:AEC family transporter [Geomonas sp.]
MNNIILLIVCFCAGIVLRRTGRFPAATPAALNGFVIHVSLPALVLLHIHRLRPDPSLIYPAAMAWCLFGIGYLFFRTLARFARFPDATVGALSLVGGLGNTSFVGLPMIEAYYGKEYLGIGIIADQAGSFLALSTVGIVVASLYSSGGDVSTRQMVRKILMFPPFQALLLALLLIPVPFPEWAVSVLQKLGDTLTPLALASVGFQLRLSDMKGELKPLAAGLFYKLVLGTAILTILFVWLLGGSGRVMQVTLFESAMAPMITAGIIAVDHDLNPALVTLMIGIGIPLSFLTLPVWSWLLRSV